MFNRKGHSPFVAIALPVPVNVRAGNVNTIRIAVRRTSKFETNQYHHLSGAVLILDFQ
ncbi:MAG: hypothetical protein HPY52_15080 [Firmicutes bacterium]|nr:hypothetical protein [Bacillota bacterium]